MWWEVLSSKYWRSAGGLPAFPHPHPHTVPQLLHNPAAEEQLAVCYAAKT